MGFFALLLLLSAVGVFVYSYKFTWFQIIRLFETFNHSNDGQVRSSSSTNLPGNSTPLGIRTQSSSFVKLMVEVDDENSQLIQRIKRFSRVIFSLTLTTTVLIMEFILIQFMKTQDGGEIDSISLFIWNSSMIFTTISIIFIQPLIVIVLLVNKFCKDEVLNKLNIKVGASLIIMLSWLLFVMKFDVLTDFNDGSFMAGLDDLRLVLVQKISIIGITLIAILNGIGSFSTFYYYLYTELINKKRNGTYDDDDVAKHRLLSLKRTLDQTENLIASKEAEIIERDSSPDPNLQKRNNTHSKGSFLDLQILNRFKSSETDELSKEIRSLTKIKNDLFIKIMKIESSLQQSSYIDSKSSFLKSRLFITGVIQKSVAVYCVFKIIQVTTVKIISFYQSYNSQDSTSVKESDPLVITVSKIIQLFIKIQDEDFLVNQLSFLISGFLFICSFNGVYLTLKHLYKFIPIDLSQLGKSSSSTKNQSVSIIKNLIISELMGIYELATLLILKSSLPITFRSTLMLLLSSSSSSASTSASASESSPSSAINVSSMQDISTIDNWFDKVFLISVVITATGIKLSEIFENEESGFEEQDLLGKIV